MGRARGKAKRDDLGSGEEEKIPVQKKRGRPQKPLKDDMEEEEEEEEEEAEAEKLEESNGEIANSSLTNKDAKNLVAIANGKKRKRTSQSKENPFPVKEENGSQTKSKADASVKLMGYRQKGSRRKSKPHRAAEAGVDCHQFLD